MILNVEGISKSFGGLLATDGVSFHVEEEELLAIIGPNGAGKTTLFNLLTGHIHPDHGRIFFKGRDITNLPPYEISRSGMGRSFQRLNIFPRLTTFENVQIALFSTYRINHQLFSSAKKLVLSETEEILEDVGLYSKRTTKGGLLAHGDQKRLEIGIALATKPDLLLLDEPTAAMSPRETEETAALIKELVSERKIALIFVEHDMNVVFGLSNKIKVLHQGRIICEGTPDEVKADAEVQRIYLGEEETHVA